MEASNGTRTRGRRRRERKEGAKWEICGEDDVVAERGGDEKKKETMKRNVAGLNGEFEWIVLQADFV